MRDFQMNVLTDHGVGSGLDNHTHALLAMPICKGMPW